MKFESETTVKFLDAYRARHEPEAQHVLGNVYWSILISLFACSLIASVAFGIWEFMLPIAEIPEDAVNQRARKILTKPELQKVLDAFDTRAEEYESRKTEVLPVKDPS